MTKYPNQCIKVFQKKLNIKLNLREQLLCKDHKQTNLKNISHFQLGLDIWFYNLIKLWKRPSTNSFEKEENYQNKLINIKLHLKNA